MLINYDILLHALHRLSFLIEDG